MAKAVKDKIIDGGGLDNLSATANKLLDISKGCRVWLFEGDLGAGKTTMIKEICSKLGVEDNVTSPTFSIINEYIATNGPIYHFDFYRIKNLQEAMNTGIEDYFFSNEYCFIEWPEVVLPILPEKHLKIFIESGTGEERRYKLTHYGID